MSVWVCEIIHESSIYFDFFLKIRHISLINKLVGSLSYFLLFTSESSTTNILVSDYLIESTVLHGEQQLPSLPMWFVSFSMGQSSWRHWSPGRSRQQVREQHRLDACFADAERPRSGAESWGSFKNLTSLSPTTRWFTDRESPSAELWKYELATRCNTKVSCPPPLCPTCFQHRVCHRPLDWRIRVNKLSPRDSVCAEEYEVHKCFHCLPRGSSVGFTTRFLWSMSVLATWWILVVLWKGASSPPQPSASLRLVPLGHLVVFKTHTTSAHPAAYTMLLSRIIGLTILSNYSPVSSGSGRATTTGVGDCSVLLKRIPPLCVYTSLVGRICGRFTFNISDKVGPKLVSEGVAVFTMEVGYTKILL